MRRLLENVLPNDKKLARQLVTLIVGSYFLFTLTVTVGQLYLQFLNEKRKVQEHISAEVQTQRTSLQQLLSSNEHDKINDLLEDFVKNNYVIGSELNLVNGQSYQAGDPSSAKQIDKSSRKYRQQFPIVSPNNRKELIANLSIYSSAAVVLEESYTMFVAIIISATVKTLVLWILVVFVVNRYIGKPINNLQNEILAYDINSEASDSSDTVELSYHSTNNELQRLHYCFAALQHELRTKNYLVNNQHKHLETLVDERTFELNQSLEKLIELDKAKSIFLANVSHELRTPLNAIIGFTRRLVKQHLTSSNVSTAEVLGIILRNSEHLLNLINQILDMTKLASGKIDLKIEEVNMKTCIDDVVLSLKALAEEKEIEVFMGDFPDATIMADHFRITQVLMNLIGNAVKFTDEGCVNVNLVRQYHQDISGVLITVTDTGIGISEQDIPKLFQQFQQLGTASLNTVPGTGLGLAIVDEIIKLHGGAIEVISELGEGSQFNVWLPVSQSVNSTQTMSVSSLTG